MAAWPTVEDILEKIDLEDAASWGDYIESIRVAAIDQVKEDVGRWNDDEDEPDNKLRNAALRMAELMATRPSVAEQPFSDPAYYALLKGRRRSFGFA